MLTELLLKKSLQKNLFKITYDYGNNLRSKTFVDLIAYVGTFE